MRNYNRTAAAIAEDTKNPALMDRFRMPQGNGDEELKAKARGFARALRDLSLNEAFAGLGHIGEDEEGHALTPDAILEQMAADFQTGAGEQGNALSDQAGATHAIPVHLRRGKGAVKIFDAIYNNVYKGNAEMLGAWKTASHVERAGTTSKAAVKAAPTAVAPTAANTALAASV